MMLCLASRATKEVCDFFINELLRDWRVLVSLSTQRRVLAFTRPHSKTNTPLSSPLSYSLCSLSFLPIYCPRRSPFLVSPAARSVTFSPFLITCSLFFCSSQYVLVISIPAWVNTPIYHQEEHIQFTAAIKNIAILNSSQENIHSRASLNVFHVITSCLLMYNEVFSHTYQYPPACTLELDVLSGTYCLSYSGAYPLPRACSPTRTGIPVN